MRINVLIKKSKMSGKNLVREKKTLSYPKRLFMLKLNAALQAKYIEKLIKVNKLL